MRIAGASTVRRLLCGLALVSAGLSAEPLRARLGGSGRTVVRVLGIDDEAGLRIAADDGAPGEAVLPLAEARGLQFLLPAEYRQAQRLAFAGRGGEALRMLRRVVPALVPFAAVAESNAGAAVRFHLELLITEREWVEALALATELPVADGTNGLRGSVLGLAEALQAQGRERDAIWLLASMAAPEGASADRARFARLADAWRRENRWDAARSMYSRLRDTAAPGERRWWELLLAWVDRRSGRDGTAVERLAGSTVPPVATEAGALYRLLVGMERLDAGDARGALDVLSEGLVGLEAATEWRPVLAGALADAYRAAGRADVADTIFQDLQRLHPNLRWLNPNST